MVLDLVRSEGFRAGFLIGTLGALGVLLAASRGRELSPAGVAVIATLIGLEITGSLPGALIGAVAAVALMSFVLRNDSAPAGVPLPLAMLPGAVLVAVAADSTGPAWLGPFAVLTAVTTTTCLSDFRAAPPIRGFEATLIGLTALGIYAAVPETDPVTVLIGALFAVSALSVRRVPSFWNPATASALAAMLVWAAAEGGQTRPGSVLGATVCFGVLLVDPLVVRALHARDQPTRARGAALRLLALLAIHAGIVAIGSRVVGLRVSATQAAVLSAATLLGATVAVGAVELASRPRIRRSR